MKQKSQTERLTSIAVMPTRHPLNASEPKARLRKTAALVASSVALVVALQSQPAAAFGEQIPNDAFAVSQSVSYTGNGDGAQVVVDGRWDFRDDWIGADRPDDVATVTTNAPCFHVQSISWSITDYNHDNSNGYAFLKEGGANGSPVIQIHKQNVGFVLQTSHGVMHVVYARNPGCSQGLFGSEFIYQTNIGGGDVIGVSAGWGFLNVSLGGSPQSLQKSTQPTWINVPAGSPVPVPASGRASPVYHTLGSGLRIHTAPGLEFPVVAAYGPTGTTVPVICQTASGSRVGNSNIWDLTPQGFVADWWVSTSGAGTFTAGLPRCA